MINHKLMDTRTAHFKWFYWNRDQLWDSLSQHGWIAATMYSRSEVKDPVIVTPCQMWILWSAFDPSFAKDAIGSSGKCQAGRWWKPFYSLCYDPAGDQTHNLPVSRRRERARAGQRLELTSCRQEVGRVEWLEMVDWTIIVRNISARHVSVFVTLI